MGRSQVVRHMICYGFDGFLVVVLHGGFHGGVDTELFVVVLVVVFVVMLVLAGVGCWW